jgi:hypothetical protein
MNSVEEGAAPLDTFIKLSGQTTLMLFTCFTTQGGRRCNGGGEQRAAGSLLAACGTPGDALDLLYCAGWQKGMVVVNNVLLGRYWPRVGPLGDALYLYTVQGGRREWWR